MRYSKFTENKIEDYYKCLYRERLRLKDWLDRVKNRIKEEEVEEERLKQLQFLLGEIFAPGKKCLIVGAGTGGAAIVLFKKFKCEVWGIEPDEKALDIIHSKCKEIDLSPDNFKKEYCEKMSFPEEEFDFIYCFTVLEHVNDVSQCIDEMIRVLKRGGVIYINTPNYQFPYEGHYKIPFPTFLPKIFGYIFLLLLRRPTKYFFKNINYITSKDIDKILFKKNNIIYFRIFRGKNLEKKTIIQRIYAFIQQKLLIYPTQEVIIKKV